MYLIILICIALSLTLLFFQKNRENFNNTRPNITFVSSCYDVPNHPDTLDILKFTPKIKWVIFTDSSYLSVLPKQNKNIKYILGEKQNVNDSVHNNINLVKKAIELNHYDTKNFCWFELDYLKLNKNCGLSSILPMFPDNNLVELFCKNDSLKVLKSEKWDKFILGNKKAFEIQKFEYISPFSKKTLLDDFQKDPEMYMFNYLMSNYFKKIHTPDLYAGLGNKIFQVFSVYSKALQTNDLFIINKNHIKTTIHSSNTYLDNIFRKFLITDTKYEYSIYRETLEFRPFKIIGTSTYNLYDGYFQHIKNIRLSENSDIVFPDTDLLVVRDNPESIYFIHFRFGDYVGSVHEVDLRNYYKKSIKYILSRDKNANFLIFSNDMEKAKTYVKTNLNRELSGRYKMDVSTSELDSISKMKNCIKGGICPNSTFSWWGGYINKNPEKIVVIPSRWFNDKQKFYRDIAIMVPMSLSYKQVKIINV